MTGPALAMIEAHLTFSSNVVNKPRGTITSYPEIIKQLLRRYATEAVIANVDDEIRNFKQESFTPWDFSQTLRDSKLCCGGVYNRKTLKSFFAEGIDLSVCSAMLHWCQNDRETPLENSSNHVQSLLDLQSVTSYEAKKNEYQDQRPYGGQNGIDMNRQVLAVQSSNTPSTSRKMHIFEFSTRNVVKPVKYASSGNRNESDSTFRDS